MGNDGFSEVEEVESVKYGDEQNQNLAPQGSNRSWMMALLLGTCLGMGLTVMGMSLLRPRSPSPTKAVESKSVQIAMTVTAAPVASGSVNQTLDTTGTIAARDLIPVLPQVNGLQIKKIPEDVKEGAFVRQGQVLAILDDSVLQAQINQARADMESDQADVQSKQADLASKQATVTANQAIAQQRRADLAQAQARLEEAQKNLQRYQQLVASGAVSQQEYDTRAYTVKTAVESVRVAQENIRTAMANVASAQANIGNAAAMVNKSQAIVRSSAAKIEQLKTQLEQTIVRSPVSGVIAEKLARIGDVTGVPPQTQVGTVVGGAQKLFSIIKEGKLELQAKVPEVELAQVKIGSVVEVTSDLNRQASLQGRVREIQPVVNDTRREATVKIDLPTNNVFKVGMFARAKINVDTSKGMVIPQKAIQSQADGSVIVFVLSGEDLDNDQNVEVRTVRSQKVAVAELMPGDKVAIKEGLKLGEQVVIDGAGYLKDGDRVRVVSQ
jgi:HlyD family secretion protein